MQISPFDALSQRNIYSAKRFAFSIGWRSPKHLRSKIYPYNSAKRGWDKGFGIININATPPITKT